MEDSIGGYVANYGFWILICVDHDHVYFLDYDRFGLLDYYFVEYYTYCGINSLTVE